ncbi:MAG: CHAT domain-containing protein [Myxococcales bacterium]|nr:CHAT domain-containing protein [Myxococcales bacterium]
MQGEGGAAGRVEVDVDLRSKSPKDKRKRRRKWSQITGITLHQTGIHGFGERAWPRVTAHLGVHSDGRVFLIHPLESYLWSSNGFNRDTVAIEVAGNFLGDESNPRSYWAKGGGPTELNEAMVAGLRRAIRYIIQEVRAGGGAITEIHAHRQTRRAKSNCPGAAIWREGGVWAQEELGLSDGGPGYTRDDGQPIPPAWDPRLADQPLDFSDDSWSIDLDDFEPEEGDEAPADGDRFFVDADEAAPDAASARIRGLPAGLRLVADAGAGAGAGAGEGSTTTRGAFDLSGPIDLDGEVADPIAGLLGDALGGVLVEADVLRLEGGADEGAPTRGLGEGPVDLGGEELLDFEITVDDDEGAIVLLEEDGAFRWVLPEVADDGDAAGGERVRGAAEGSARFRIPLLPARAVGEGAGQGEATRGAIGDFVRGKITARIYKYVADRITGAATKAALHHIEGKRREGPVLIRGTELRDWIDADDLSDLELPEDRPPRILLFVHGTFSSVRGSFGGLCEGTGQDALGRMLAGYDAVFGVDHRTLTRLPRDNAALIRDLLVGHRWPQPPAVDVIAFSRGGLVARELVERLLPVSGWAGTIRRVVFVATTNAGTELARPRNWSDFVDAYTTLACNAVRLIGASVGLGAGFLAGVLGGEIINVIGELVKSLSRSGSRVEIAPGLAAMDPEGETVRNLNGSALPAVAGERPIYYRITSAFDASGSLGEVLEGRLGGPVKAFLADRITRKLYRDAASDLVVDNASTGTLHPALKFADALHFTANSAVFHVNFFFQEPVHAQLVHWLELAEVAADRGGVEIDLDLSDIEVDDALEVISFSGRGGEEEGEGDELFDLHVRARAPAEVVASRAFRVDVELAREALEVAAGALGEGAAQALALAREELEVEVIARAGVRALNHTPILVRPPARGAVIGLFVDVMAEETGCGELWVMVRQGGRALARIALKVAIVEAGAEVAVAGVLEVAQQAAPADHGAEVSLEVIELRAADGLRYRYHLRAPDLGLNHRFESPPIQGAADDVYAGLYARIEGEWKASGHEPKRFDRRLRALGVQLGEQLMPRELRALLWRHRGALDGLVLLSDEGHIPWEIVHLRHPDEPLPAGESAFLGELGMVRALWGSAPARSIAVRPGRAFTVVPSYPAPALALPSAASERAWLAEHLATAELTPDPEAILERLETPGAFDLLHVACHGEIADREAWLIMQGEVREVREGGAVRRKWFPARLAASEVAASAALRGEDGGRPLVFLNACKVARAERLLSGFAGWPGAFMGAGAGAVVAPLWSVGDGSALRFAEGFYAALLKGASFASASAAARARARKLGDPTWLAYAVFAAPDGKLSLQAGESAG